jgi:hypothetical protein
MAKRGTFGGSRFGGPGYGKAGFKRGFGRASFGRSRDIVSSGIEQEMMNFFKMAQGGKFDRETGAFMAPKPPQQEGGLSRRRTPSPSAQEPITVKIPSLEFLTGGGRVSNTTGQGINEAGPRPTGTPKSKPVKFRPKLTRGAR